MSERTRVDADGDPSLPGTGAGGRPWTEPAEPVGEPEPAPFLGPYIGLVSGVLCALIGAFLLLAPYAFDYRHGAASVPRSSVVDLATGAAVLALGFLTAGLFGATLVRRLRAPEPVRHDFAEPEPFEPPALFVEREPRPEPEPARPPEPVEPAEPEPLPPPAAPAAAPAIDAAGALRDLLTPLVAALAADLRARDEGGQQPGGPSEKD